MANMTATEQALVETLNQWAIKQGVIILQTNPLFFMQLLREQGLEIVKAEELTKIRYEHKFLREQIRILFKAINAANIKLQQLDENKELLKDRNGEPKTANPKPAPKSAPRKV